MSPGQLGDGLPGPELVLRAALHDAHRSAGESSDNTAFYSNPRFDDLVARAHRELDERSGERCTARRTRSSATRPPGRSRSRTTSSASASRTSAVRCCTRSGTSTRRGSGSTGRSRARRTRRASGPVRRLARRLAWSLGVVWAVVSIAFAVNVLLPGDPARMVAGPQARPADVARIREQLGLDRPPAVQYARFWSAARPRRAARRPTASTRAARSCLPLGRSALHLDFGKSFQMRQPVVDVIATRMPRTLLLAVAGILRPAPARGDARESSPPCAAARGSTAWPWARACSASARPRSSSPCCCRSPSRASFAGCRSTATGRASASTRGASSCPR